MRHLLVSLLCLLAVPAAAQELNAKITINHNQIQGTDASVFDNLQQTLEQFVNERQWTNLQFQKNERIDCNFNITVTNTGNTTLNDVRVAEALEGATIMFFCSRRSSRASLVVGMFATSMYYLTPDSTIFFDHSRLTSFCAAAGM